ncbi:hypothetical protein ABH994_001433 [Bradyrhizobium yuanmingense]
MSARSVCGSLPVIGGPRSPDVDRGSLPPGSFLDRFFRQFGLRGRDHHTEQYADLTDTGGRNHTRAKVSGRHSRTS